MKDLMKAKALPDWTYKREHDARLAQFLFNHCPGGLSLASLPGASWGFEKALRDAYQDHCKLAFTGFEIDRTIARHALRQRIRTHPCALIPWDVNDWFSQLGNPSIHQRLPRPTAPFTAVYIDYCCTLSNSILGTMSRLSHAVDGRITQFPVMFTLAVRPQPIGSRLISGKFKPAGPRRLTPYVRDLLVTCRDALTSDPFQTWHYEHSWEEVYRGMGQGNPMLRFWGVLVRE